MDGWIGYYNQELDTICRSGKLLDVVRISGKEIPVVSVIGAGGKTTTIHRLADEYVQSKKQVIVMTTTHMMQETHPWVCMVEEGSEQESVRTKMQKILRTHGQLWIGSPTHAGKMSQPPLWCMEEIYAQQIPVLIEADGAKRLPLKVPAPHEPVILSWTTHVISVYGMDSIGKTIEECCCRCEIAEELLGCDGRKEVEPEDIAFLAGSERSGKKGCPKDAEYIVVLNKADTEEKRQQALKIGRILSKQGVKQIVITSYV